MSEALPIVETISPTDSHQEDANKCWVSNNLAACIGTMKRQTIHSNTAYIHYTSFGFNESIRESLDELQGTKNVNVVHLK